MQTETIDQRCERLVRQEVLCCMSHVVAALAQGYDSPTLYGARSAARMNDAAQSLSDLAEQAFELSSPVLDYEEAAIQAGWTETSEGWRDVHLATLWKAESAAAVCEHFNLDPYEREVFEHWAVSDWLADQLIEQGEKVDKDFAGLCVWARTTTGQGIAGDSVIRRVIEASDARLKELLSETA